MQVYQILRDEIFTGKKKPGERIIESKIASEMGTSRSPVREAIRLLEHDGLIVNEGGNLTIFPLTAECIRDIYQCRIAVESYAAFLAVDNFTQDNIEELISLYNKAKNAEKQKNSHTTAVINTQFHMLINKVSGNKRIMEISERMLVQSHLARNILFATHKSPNDYLEEHWKIIEAIKERDKRKAEFLMREHISNVLEYLQDYLKNNTSIISNLH